MMATVGPDVMVRETAHLIASDKVEGTPVRRSNGDRIGTIERVMIDKRGGKVAYAVMTFGGFLGIGEEYRALPWSVLRYNEDLDAYELNLTDETGDMPCGITSQRLAAQHDPPCSTLPEPGDHLEECRFTGAVWPDHADDFAAAKR